jgi:hypothetical protein
MRSSLVENIHYYKEGDRVVFTTLFHIQRGQCCGNGCRNCPYLPKHLKGNLELKTEFIKFKHMNLEELNKMKKEAEELSNMKDQMSAVELQAKALELTNRLEEILGSIIKVPKEEDNE